MRAAEIVNLASQPDTPSAPAPVSASGTAAVAASWAPAGFVPAALAAAPVAKYRRAIRCASWIAVVIGDPAISERSAGARSRASALSRFRLSYCRSVVIGGQVLPQDIVELLVVLGNHT